MKDNDNDGRSQDVDSLLFEYLERTLPDKISMELEEKLAFDPSLQEELNHWVEAHVEQDFYNTDALEEKLQLIPFQKNSITSETYILTIAILTSFLSFMPLSVEKDSFKEIDQPIKMESTADNNKPINVEIQKIDPIGPSHIVETKIQELERGKSTSPYITKNEKTSDILELKTLPIEDIKVIITTIPKTEIEEKTIQNKVVEKEKGHFKTTSISRKEQRAIEKSKEKALQKRREMEFVKGKKAYVVPLSPNF